MKKMLLTTTLFLTIAFTALAGEPADKNLFKELSSALNTAKPIVYKTTDIFKSTAFMYDGKRIEAFYDNNSNLIGFAVALSVSDLPASTQENIQKKFNGWQMTEAMKLINSNGSGNYFVLATRARETAMVLMLNAKNQPCVYAKM